MTYQLAGVPLPRTVFLALEDIFGEDTAELLKQYEAKKGPLYEKWLKVRAAKIREDIDRQKAFTPEKVTV